MLTFCLALHWLTKLLLGSAFRRRRRRAPAASLPSSLASPVPCGTQWYMWWPCWTWNCRSTALPPDTFVAFSILMPRNFTLGPHTKCDLGQNSSSQRPGKFPSNGFAVLDTKNWTNIRWSIERGALYKLGSAVIRLRMACSFSFSLSLARSLCDWPSRYPVIAKEGEIFDQFCVSRFWLRHRWNNSIKLRLTVRHHEHKTAGYQAKPVLVN